MADLSHFLSEKKESLLVKKINDRDSDAFGEVYELFYEQLYYFAYKLYKDTVIDPRDVIHEAFVKLWQAPIQNFNTMLEIKAYVFVAIRNSRNTHHLQNQYSLKYIADQRQDIAQFQTDIIESEILSTFHHALSLLPEESAEILRLFFQGWSAEEIAEKLGKSKQTIYNKKSEAIAELRNKIPKHIFTILLILLS